MNVPLYIRDDHEARVRWHEAAAWRWTTARRSCRRQRLCHLLSAACRTAARWTTSSRCPRSPSRRAWRSFRRALVASCSPSGICCSLCEAAELCYRIGSVCLCLSVLPFPTRFASFPAPLHAKSNNQKLIYISFFIICNFIK